MNYSELNKTTYDELANEYEKRVDILTPVTEEAMNWFSHYIKPNGSVLDIGCAVGLAMGILNEKGFKTTGLEISPKMAEFAKQRNPGSEIIVGDFFTTNFNEKFDAILAFAFIHLFPKKEVNKILEKFKQITKVGGVVLIGTTESSKSYEGWEIKEDYDKKEKRFRKHWTEKELTGTLEEADFKILDVKKFIDPLDKVWMDFIVQPTNY